jgi:hypothetical protein
MTKFAPAGFTRDEAGCFYGPPGSLTSTEDPTLIEDLFNVTIKLAEMLERCDNYFQNRTNEIPDDSVEALLDSIRQPEEKQGQADSFERELQHLLNKHSIDNDCGMPDFTLAHHVGNYISSLKQPELLEPYSNGGRAVP